MYGPFTSAGQLRGAIQVLQRVFKFRTCGLDIEESDTRWRWFRPCLLASIQQCTAPCNLRISKEDYRRDIRRLQTFLEGGSVRLLAQMREEMAAASKNLDFEKAARLRDEIKLLENLDRRGEIDTHAQPEVFYIDPKKGMRGLKKVLAMDPRTASDRSVDIAHLGGTDTVASLVQFIDGYRLSRISTIQDSRCPGIDDFRSIYEVVSRRFKKLDEEQATFPDLLMIDGGKGQLNAALPLFEILRFRLRGSSHWPNAKKRFINPASPSRFRLNRHAFALRLLQYVRDEAHRFAQHYHHILRRKSSIDESS